MVRSIILAGAMALVASSASAAASPTSGIYVSLPLEAKRQMESATSVDAPEAAIAKVAKLCVDRGFTVRRQSAPDIICQAGGLLLGSDGFHPHMTAMRPATDPKQFSQVYAHFVGLTVQGGTRINSTVSTAMPSFSGNFSISLDMNWSVTAQLREFYGALGMSDEGLNAFV